MALIEGREMFSSIRNSTRFSLLLPEGGARTARAVLYLLPVRRGLATDWVRYTGIELLARRMNLAVVMPEGVSSDFCNMVYGMKWWDFLTEELPDYLNAVFGLPAGSLCFGAEMGGLAAVRLGLRFPEQFSAVGAAGTDFLRVARFAEGRQADHDLESIYGAAPVPEAILDQYDPLRLAARPSVRKPALFLCREDEGAETLAKGSEQQVHWFRSSGRSWEEYGDCLEEFLENTML